MSAALRRRIVRVTRRQQGIDDEHEQERARAEADEFLAVTQVPLPEYPKGWEWLRLWRGTPKANKFSRR
jgi:hypothetical protein